MATESSVTRSKKKPPTPEQAEPPPSFEETIQRLGVIVEQLESGELPLEQSLQLFEEGMRMARASQKILDDAEARVEELLGFTADEQPIVRELDPEE